MLSEVRVRRLARRAERRRRDGRRGRRARRAWERLVREGDSGNPHASEAVWQRWAWTGPPDDERWELLARWLGPRAVGRVMEAAADPGLDAARRSRLASFCTRHGLAPEDPAERVRFFLLTGQQEQRRALDPDGALLAAAYQTACPPQRAALRVALAGVGDLDVTRMIAASGAMRLADMTTAEREYLADRLADRGDWAGLWRLARDLPLYDAVAAVRRIGGRWRPDGQHDRELFGFLAAPTRRRCAGPGTRWTRQPSSGSRSRARRLPPRCRPAAGAGRPDRRRNPAATQVRMAETACVY